MNNYKILTQKKWFSNNENVEDEFGNRKLITEFISCDYIEYNGDVIDLDEKKKKYLDENNLPYADGKFYGALKSILFKNNDGEIVNEVDVFGDHYWKLYNMDSDGEVLIGSHQCNFNIKKYKEQLLKNSPSK